MSYHSISHIHPRLSRRRFIVLGAGGALLAIPTARTLAATDATPAAAVTATPPANTFLDAMTVHEITATFDKDDYDAMIQSYADSGDKDWIKATVTIDGESYKKVGMRLKGNSSLMVLRSNDNGGNGNVVRGGIGGNISADEPQGLPWLVRLDKYEDGQNHNGITELVIRANNSQTSLNEAIALELLADAGLASQAAASTAFSVNGGDRALRLAIENPDDAWMTEHFPAGGLLFKSEASGDWSYRGADASSYAGDIFDLEAGGTDDDNTDFAGLIAFLDFVNNSDDATFAAQLPNKLDVDQFAVYLAMMDLIANSDDIDGPGNNSYLYEASGSGQFTVVPWDMNLAFGGLGGMRGGNFPGVPNGGQIPGNTVIVNGDAAAGTPATSDTFPATGTPGAGGDTLPSFGNGTPPDRGDIPQGGNFGGFNGQPNPLVSRFTADTDWAALVDEQTSNLRDSLYTSGAAEAILARWVGVLQSGASDLVDSATIASESDAISSFFTGS